MEGDSSKRRSISPLTIIALVLLAVVLAAVGLVNYQNYSARKVALEKQQATLEAYQRLPDMPVLVHYRQALMGAGLVASFRNTSARDLAVLATFTNPTLNQSKTFRLDLAPGQTREIGHLEGWTFASGDTIKLTHNDYKALTVKLP